MIDLYKDLIIDHGLNPRNKYIIKIIHTQQKDLIIFAEILYCIFNDNK